MSPPNDVLAVRWIDRPTTFAFLVLVVRFQRVLLYYSRTVTNVSEYARRAGLAPRQVVSSQSKNRGRGV